MWDHLSPNWCHNEIAMTQITWENRKRQNSIIHTLDNVCPIDPAVSLSIIWCENIQLVYGWYCVAVSNVLWCWGMTLDCPCQIVLGYFMWLCHAISHSSHNNNPKVTSIQNRNNMTYQYTPSLSTQNVNIYTYIYIYIYIYTVDILCWQGG